MHWLGEFSSRRKQSHSKGRCCSCGGCALGILICGLILQVHIVLSACLQWIIFVLLCTVTLEWFSNTSDSHSIAMAWASVGCISLGTLVQVVLVDKSAKRKLMSLTQVKLLVDAWHSYTEGALTQGYGTGKFVEAVYEAFLEVHNNSSHFSHLTVIFCSFYSSQGCLQSYWVSRNYEIHGEMPSVLLVGSIVSSINAMALVLVLFFQGKSHIEGATDNSRVKICIYLYHFAEVALRTCFFALIGITLEAGTLLVLPVIVLLRFWIRKSTGDQAPTSMVFTSIFIDSAFTGVHAFRLASAITLAETLASVLLAITTGISRPGFGSLICVITGGGYWA